MTPNNSASQDRFSRTRERIKKPPETSFLTTFSSAAQTPSRHSFFVPPAILIRFTSAAPADRTTVADAP